MKICVLLLLGCLVSPVLTLAGSSSPVDSSTHPKPHKVKKHKAVKHKS